MVTRAGLSSAAFDEVFDSDQQCLAAVSADSLARLSHVVENAAAHQEGWLERVRVGLVALLGFFDDEPQRARLLVLDTPMDPAAEHERRRQLHHVLTRLIEVGHGSNDSGATDVGHRDAPAVAGVRARMSPALTAELVAGGVFSVIRTGLVEQDSSKLVELAPSLMAFIVAPFLGPAAARLELQGKSARRPEAIGNDRGRSQMSGSSRSAAIFRAQELPVRATHRTTMVLRAIARAPYSTNREVAQAAELADEGQASKLLARLERQGVIENVGLGPARGEPNAWVLTATGRRTIKLINESFASGAPRPRRTRMKEAP